MKTFLMQKGTCHETRLEYIPGEYPWKFLVEVCLRFTNPDPISDHIRVGKGQQ